MAKKISSSEIRVPTVESVEVARRAFAAQEPRHLFYRVATELIDLALKNQTKVSVAEALAVLLQTWNAQFYRFGRVNFDEEHFQRIELLVTNNLASIEGYRRRSISGFAADDEDRVRLLFSRFEDVLVAVCAAKSLHLLAPSFFPLWDRKIAKAYHLNLDGGAFDEYIKFMRLTQRQRRALAEQGAKWSDTLKALDEYNFCTYTLKVDSQSAP